jgi:hypothetical protein
LPVLQAMSLYCSTWRQNRDCLNVLFFINVFVIDASLRVVQIRSDVYNLCCCCVLFLASNYSLAMLAYSNGTTKLLPLASRTTKNKHPGVNAQTDVNKIYSLTRALVMRAPAIYTGIYPDPHWGS